MPVDAVRFVPRYDTDVTLLVCINVSLLACCMKLFMLTYKYISMIPRQKMSSVEVHGISLGTVPLAPGVSDNVVNIY